MNCVRMLENNKAGGLNDVTGKILKYGCGLSWEWLHYMCVKAVFVPD